MATTGLLKECPACSMESPKEGNKCPSCGFVIYSKPNKVFDGPAYISIQLSDRMAELGTKATADKEKREIEEEKIKWFRDCSDLDREAAMNDAHDTLRNLMHSNACTETFKAIIGKARAMGKLADALDQYIRTGGQLHGIGLPTAPKPGDSEEDTSQTGIVGDIG